MKIGVRKPSIKRSIKARTTAKVTRSIKKATNPFYSKKGTGLITDPKRAVYNKVYHKTTVSAVPKISKGARVKSSSTNPVNELNKIKYSNLFIGTMIVLGFVLLFPWFYAWYLLRKRKKLRMELEVYE